MPKIKITKSKVDVLPNPEKGQVLYTDSELPGFAILVGAKSKTYVAQRDVARRTVRVTIGRHGIIKTDKARDEARQLIARMALGENPNKTKREDAARSITLRRALEAYELTLANKDRSPRTVEGYRQSINSHLKDWLDKPLIDIDRKTVRTRHQKIGKKGRYAANGAMRAFRAVWNRTMKEHEELPVCPVISVDWYKEKPRKAAVPTSDLHDLYKRIEHIENPIRRDYFEFVLFTGMRRRATAQMRWDEVDFENAMLHVPNPKGGEERAFDLPLSVHLMEMLQRRREEDVSLESPWVFPAIRCKSGHIEEPKEPGLPGPHALRHTYVTAATNAGVNPYLVKLLTNHSLPRADVTAGYIGAEGNDLRHSQEMITGYLLSHIHPTSGDVVNIGKQKFINISGA
jgi:integrase